MKNLLIAISLFLICSSLAAGGRKEVEFTSRNYNEILDVEKKGKIKIDNTAGSVTIRSWDRDKVQVQGKIGKDVKEVIFRTSGRTTTLKVELPKKIWDWNNNSKALLEITLPADSDLDINTVSAEIAIMDVRGEIEAGTVSGSLFIEEVESDYLTLNSASGSINMQGSAKTLEANTLSGAISIKGPIDELRCTSVSGSLNYMNGNSDIIYMKTTSGQVSINCNLQNKARVDLNSLSGNVILIIPARVDARFSLKSFSGSVDYIDFINMHDLNTVDITNNNDKKKIDFVLGRGNGRISAESFSGSVILEAK